MSGTITGYVKKATVKTGTSRRGPWTLHGAFIDNGTGNDVYISVGFEQPTFKEGDYGSFAYKDDGKFKNLETFTKLPAPERESINTSPNTAHPQSPADRNASIVYQSSRKDAIAVLGLLIDKDALPLSKAAGGAGIAKRYEEIMALVDKLTVRYYNDVGTLRVLETVEDENDHTHNAEPDTDEDD